MKIYVGLDTAKNMGVAFYRPDNHCVMTLELKGNPLQQLSSLKALIANHEKIETELVFVFERLHNFLNANTTRDLLTRYGFLYYSLLQAGATVCEVSPRPARSALGMVSKSDAHAKLIKRCTDSHARFSNNHSDAIVCAIYQSILQGHEYRPDDLIITIWRDL